MRKDILRIVGLKIAYYRKLKKWKQMELAEKVGVSTSYISRIERGAAVEGAPLLLYLAIAEALELNFGLLVDPGGNDEKRE